MPYKIRLLVFSLLEVLWAFKRLFYCLWALFAEVLFLRQFAVDLLARIRRGRVMVDLGSRGDSKISAAGSVLRMWIWYVALENQTTEGWKKSDTNLRLFNLQITKHPSDPAFRALQYSSDHCSVSVWSWILSGIRFLACPSCFSLRMDVLNFTSKNSPISLNDEIFIFVLSSKRVDWNCSPWSLHHILHRWSGCPKKTLCGHLSTRWYIGRVFGSVYCVIPQSQNTSGIINILAWNKVKEYPISLPAQRRVFMDSWGP